MESNGIECWCTLGVNFLRATIYEFSLQFSACLYNWDFCKSDLCANRRIRSKKRFEIWAAPSSTALSSTTLSRNLLQPEKSQLDLVLLNLLASFGLRLLVVEMNEPVITLKNVIKLVDVCRRHASSNPMDEDLIYLHD